MIYTMQKSIDSKLIDVHLNNLNNIQNTISRLSNIGLKLFSYALTITSLGIPLSFSINVSEIIRFLISFITFIVVLMLFISHLVNLKNERVWVKIYNSKANLNIAKIESENIIGEILKIDFQGLKKEIKLYKVLRSWWTLCWLVMILLIIVVCILIFFIY